MKFDELQLEDYDGWRVRAVEILAQAATAFESGLSDNPSVVQTTVSEAESLGATLEKFHADSVSFLEMAQARWKPLQGEGTEFDRKTVLANTITDYSRMEKLLNGYRRRVDKRIDFGRTIISYAKARI